MKSSSNVEETSVTSLIKAWNPAEFESQGNARLVSAQQMLDILGPLSRDTQIKPVEHPRLIRAAESAQRSMRSWNPGDISQQMGSIQTISSSRPATDTFFPPLPQRPSERRAERRPERVSEVHAPVHMIVEEDKLAKILAEAQARADLLIQEAQTRASEIIERAKDEAGQAVEEGRQQGYDQGQAEAASSIQATRAMLAETAAWREQVVNQSEEAVIEMIRRIARLMFGEGLQLDRNALQVYLNEVMETTRSLGELNIFLSPDDYRQLDSAWAEYYTQIRGIRVTMIGSNNILPGGCYVQGQMGTVDARIETKLSAVMETLASSVESGASE